LTQLLPTTHSSARSHRYPTRVLWVALFPASPGSDFFKRPWPMAFLPWTNIDAKLDADTNSTWNHEQQGFQISDTSTSLSPPVAWVTASATNASWNKWEIFPLIFFKEQTQMLRFVLPSFSCLTCAKLDRFIQGYFWVKITVTLFASCKSFFSFAFQNSVLTFKKCYRTYTFNI